MIVKNYESKKIDIKLNKFFLLNGDNDGAKEDFIKSILCCNCYRKKNKPGYYYKLDYSDYI